MRFLIRTVSEIIIQSVLNTISVGSDFFILAQIRREEVSSVIKCNHQISAPNINPGTMTAAFAIQAENSIIL